MPGKLFLTTMDDILSGDLSTAKILAEGEFKGFIAPPVLVDINNDQVQDIVVNAVEGKTIAIDGISYKTLWSTSLPGTEIYGSLAVGHFNNDLIPDFFINHGIGQFPKLHEAVQVV